MSPADPRSWLDRAVGGCLAALVAAGALFIAVRLIEAVFSALLVILGVVVATAAGICIVRMRHRGW